MPSLSCHVSAIPLTRPATRAVALAALAFATTSCLNDRSLTPPATSSASIVVAAERVPGGPDLGLTTARVVLRPVGVYGDSVVATGPWTGDSAVIQTPVSVVSTSQFFDVLVAVVNARGDTLLRGSTRIRLYSLFTISTRLGLTYAGIDADLSTLRVLPRDTTVAAGGTFTARVVGTNAAGVPVSPILVAWASRDTTLFIVNASGQVTAKSLSGTAYIVATTFTGKKDSTTITVRTGITSTVVQPQSATLRAITNQQALTATAYLGATPTPGVFTWTSRNTAVATVSATGVVTAVANGTTYVVAVEAGGTKDSSLITVRQDVATLTISPPSATIPLGATQQFTVTATDAAGFPVTNLVATDYVWSTNNPAVATVDAGGLATSRAIGGPVAVTVAVGSKTATAQLTVGNNVASVVVTPSPIVCDALGQQRTVTATAYNASGQVVTGASFTWQIVGSAIVSFGGASGSTNVVICISVGSTSITATSQ
ncbi:MAG: Ig-like domain-containing protein, partial [Gemmatimonadaceae bacterium]